MGSAAKGASERQITVVGHLRLPAEGEAGLSQPLYSELRRIKPFDEDPLVTLEPQTRTTMGRYHVLGCLGQGGMGVVYRAYDPELERPIALKVVRTISKKRDIDSEYQREFQLRMIQEARSLARLVHPNIVTIYDVGVVDDTDVFIAMELIAGKDLATVCREKKTLGLDAILDLYLEAGEGLAAAHRVGIVHRDFKPENCIVGNDGHVRVLDFGLALTDARDTATTDPYLLELSSVSRSSISKLTRSGRSRRVQDIDTNHVSAGLPKLTQLGVAVGTPRYMAPEQVRGKNVTAQCDVFSFCLCLYEAICRVYPFDTDSPKSRLESIARDSLKWPTSVPSWLREQLTSGLAYKPERRPADLGELLQGIRRGRARAHSRKQWLVRSFLVLTTSISLLAAWPSLRANRGPEVIDCSEQANQIGKIWSAKTAEKLAWAFTRADQIRGPALWSTVKNRIGPWVEEWKEAKQLQCSISYPDAENPLSSAATKSRLAALPAIGTADAEMARMCLEQRFAQLETLVEGWSKPDVQVLEGAVATAELLTQPASCLDPAEVRATAPLPKSPHLRAEVQRLRLELKRLEIAQSQARFAEIDTKIKTLRGEIFANGDDALAAELYSFLERAFHLHQPYGESVLAFEQGIQHALRAGHWRAAATLRIQEIFYRHYQLRDTTFDTASALRDAASWSQASGSPPFLESRLARTRALIFWTQGQAQKAHLQFVEAAAFARKSTEGESLALGSALDDLAIILQFLGQTRDSLVAAQESLEIRRRIFGNAHAEVARSHSNISYSRFALGEYPAALDSARQAVESCIGSGAGDLACAGFLRDYAEMLRLVGNFQHAQEIALRTLATAADRTTLGIPEDEQFEVKVARIFALRGMIEEAVDLAQVASRKVVEDGGAPPDAIGSTLESQAWILIEAGKWNEATAILQQATDQTRTDGRSRFEVLRLQLLARQASAEGKDLTAFELGEDALRILDSEYNSDGMGPWESNDLRAQLLLKHGALGGAQVEAEMALHELEAQDGILPHVRYSLQATLAQIKLRQGKHTEALDHIFIARGLFDPAQVLDNRLARVDFVQAQAIWVLDDSDDARQHARALAETALERYLDWNAPMNRQDVVELRRWLRDHGGRGRNN